MLKKVSIFNKFFGYLINFNSEYLANSNSQGKRKKIKKEKECLFKVILSFALWATSE